MLITIMLAVLASPPDAKEEFILTIRRLTTLPLDVVEEYTSRWQASSIPFVLMMLCELWSLTRLLGV